MPTTAVIVISVVVAAFCIFAAALAYGEYQTRQFKREPEADRPLQEGGREWREAA